ncbi:Uncharacterised protein [Acinetobacter baumannii]|nr:Uncharacterised protein [Acinetobacter baumannii]
MIEQAARRPQNRYLLPTQQGLQLRHIAGDILRVAHDDQFGAVEQCAPHLERRRIERRAREEEQHVIGRDSDAGRGRQPAHRVLLEHHAFRDPRRSRGIDHRAEPVGAGDDRQILPLVRQAVQIAQREDGHRVRHHRRQRLGGRLQAFPGDEHRRARFFENMPNARLRIIAGERHIGRTGFQHRQQRHHHFQAFLAVQRNQRVRLGGAPGQRLVAERNFARQAIRHAVQLTVADMQPLKLQRNLIRITQRDRLKPGAEGFSRQRRGRVVIWRHVGGGIKGEVA